jgi:hypothetical protein
LATTQKSGDNKKFSSPSTYSIVGDDKKRLARMNKREMERKSSF